MTVIFIILGMVTMLAIGCNGPVKSDLPNHHLAVWFAPINDPNKPDWEIFPQERQAGEVILSKRNELGILSNFAATPFELYGKRYASVEGFWQMDALSHVIFRAMPVYLRKSSTFPKSFLNTLRLGRREA